MLFHEPGRYLHPRMQRIGREDFSQPFVNFLGVCGADRFRNRFQSSGQEFINGPLGQFMHFGLNRTMEAAATNAKE